MFILRKLNRKRMLTKVWITRSGKCLLCNNNSNIPPRELRYLLSIIEASSEDIKALWKETFGSISFYR